MSDGINTGPAPHEQVTVPQNSGYNSAGTTLQGSATVALAPPTLTAQANLGGTHTHTAAAAGQQRMPVSPARAFFERVVGAIKSKQASTSTQSKSQQQQQVPNWSKAIEGDKSFGGRFRAVDRKPFMFMFLMFFGAFCWFYILYNIHHRGDSKHTSNSEHGAPQQATQASSPADQNRFGAFGSPRSDTGFPITGGVPVSASTPFVPHEAPSQFGTAGSGAVGAYPISGSSQSYQAVMPHGFDRNAAIVAPRTYRHAVAAPISNSMNYFPAPNGRQRMVINR